MTYFAQLEQSLNALRATFVARRGQTANLRAELAEADAYAGSRARVLATIRAELRDGLPVAADALIAAERVSNSATYAAECIRRDLEHAEALEAEAYDNLKHAAENLIAEVAAMVMMEHGQAEPIARVWNSLEN